MFRDGTGFKKIYIACGYTDLRYGVDGFASIIQNQYHLDPFDTGTLFLFCGRRSDRIKGLLWEGDGFLLLYKRLSDGSFRWPRSVEDMRHLSAEQFKRLMSGFTIDSSIRKTNPKYIG
jgi:transposase